MKAASIRHDLLYYRGRVGLREILLGLGLVEGDSVATQAFTCSAVPEAILATGCNPLFIDLEENGVNLCPTDLQKKLSSDVKCIIVQHTFGVPAQIDRIMEIANARRIPVVEDCCHSFSSKHNGQTVGSFGVAAFYSHEWGKPVICGVGGSIRVNDPELLELLRDRYGRFTEPSLSKRIRLSIQYLAFSILYRPSLYWPLKRAFHALSRKGMAEGNYNDLDGQPSPEFGLKMPAASRRRFRAKIVNLDEFAVHSESISSIYASSLNSRHAAKVRVPDSAETVYSRYPVWAHDKPVLMERARESNLEAADWYATPVHPYMAESLRKVGYIRGSCPNAELACSRIVSLPVHARTTKSQASKIASLLSGSNSIASPNGPSNLPHRT